MQTNQGPWPGRFIWHDLVTKDVRRAQDFYCGLFDWQVQAMPGEKCVYHMITAGPGPIGGMIEEPKSPVSHWMPYVAVKSVDAEAKRVTELGGKLQMPPTDIPQTGRFCVAVDPTGAYFSMYTGLPESPGFDPDLPVQGRVCWNELLTTDPAKAQTFYSKLLGWKVQSKDMGPMGTYNVQMLGEAKAGGLMKAPQPGMPSAWLAYFFTTDLDATTAKGKKLGAQVIVPPSPIPEVGRFSLLVDPTGAHLGLFSL